MLTPLPGEPGAHPISPDPRPHACLTWRSLRELLDASEWFARREVVGSSLLFVWDYPPEGSEQSPAAPICKMIDFAKTEELPEEGAKLSHRKTWEVGNREDGYLLGGSTTFILPAPSTPPPPLRVPPTPPTAC